MSRKKWNIQTADPVAVKKLVERLSLPEAIAQVVVARGFSTVTGVEEFFRPSLAGLSDPFALPDMKTAVERIWNAIDAEESIAVFGDYDVDGITSTALLFRILSVLGASVQSFVPDRIDEGYGLSLDAMERCLADLEPTVLVSVDCGTNSVESVSLAGSRGVDVIVTDHHEPAEETAPAFALINPKLGDCGEILSGVGVAFKLAHALVKAGRSQGRTCAKLLDLRRYLDIVALGTVADIVPLVGENRILVRHGLAQLNASQWAGMEALKEVASIKGEANTGQLGFQLGPRINAAGRIGEPMQAVRLLTTDDPLEARNIAKLLDRTNQERRDIERKMADDAFAEIDLHYNPEKDFGLVVAREGWHPGVVGIVASRVSRHYNRPSIILGMDADGTARGSCRGIAEFDLLAGLQACEAYLDTYGGHKMAAGLALKAHMLDAFRTAFNAVARDRLSSVDLTPVQQVDAVADAAELDWRFYESLRQLRPFGQDNPEPIWALLGARVIGAPRVVGQHHLKLMLGIASCTFEAIAFNYPLELLPAGKIDVAFTLQENSWHGNVSLQLQVQDIRPAK